MGRVAGVLPAIFLAGCVYRGCEPVGEDDYEYTPDASSSGKPTTTSTTPDATATTSPDAAPAPAPTGPETLVISEVRSHGAGGDGWGDDFVELYNTGDAPVTVDGAWQVKQMTAQGAGCQGAPVTNFIGLGQVVPPHAHLLLGGWEYGKFDSTTPAEDSPLLNSTVDYSLADAGSIWLAHGTKVIDALCFYYDDQTLGFLHLTCAPTPYQCRGAPISNLPHDGSSQASSSVNASLQRKVGAPGTLQNTADNSADFQMLMPATPQNLQSPLGP
jgi:hypothetical protein